jgi:hypothetical protein
MNIKTVDGLAYITISDAAKYLSISTVALRKIALSEGLEFVNFRENGKLWVSLESVRAIVSRKNS